MLLSACIDLYSQNVDAKIVVDNTSTPANTVLQVQVKTKTGTQDFVGVNMYFLYQQANLAPQSTADNTIVGVNDATLTTIYGWGSSLRTSTPFQNFGPSTYGGQSYNKRYVYVNADETGGTHVQTLTTSWITLFTITLNNLQGTYPQGGYGYLQETAEFMNASLVDPNGVNVPIDVITGSVPMAPPPVGVPDLTSSQFLSTTQIAGGGFIDEVIVLRNVGTTATSGQIVFGITNYSSLTGLTVTPVVAGTNVTIGIDTYTISNGWTFDPVAGTFTSTNVIPAGGNNNIGVRFTRGTGASVGANGRVTQTTTITSGTGGGEAPATNNSISNSILKF
jgi:hypothetical protein